MAEKWAADWLCQALDYGKLGQLWRGSRDAFDYGISDEDLDNDFDEELEDDDLDEELGEGDFD